VGGEDIEVSGREAGTCAVWLPETTWKEDHGPGTGRRERPESWCVGLFLLLPIAWCSKNTIAQVRTVQSKEKGKEILRNLWPL
jgi:hypothetical protein